MSRKSDREFNDFLKIAFLIVLVCVFVGVFAWRFLTLCVFEWPIRWDVGQCWNEQVKPAQDAAVEKAIDFLPRGRK